jgi:hypothetical protein
MNANRIGMRVKGSGMLDLVRFPSVCIVAGLFSVAATVGHTQPKPTHPIVTAPIVGNLPVSNAPQNGPGGGFTHAQELTAPYGLQTVNAATLTNTSTTPSYGVFNVQNPSVFLDVPITPNGPAYVGEGPSGVGGLNFAYKSIGWKGNVSLEACLTTQEALAWVGTIQSSLCETACRRRPGHTTRYLHVNAILKGNGAGQ